MFQLREVTAGACPRTGWVPGRGDSLQRQGMPSEGDFSSTPGVLQYPPQGIGAGAGILLG